MAPSALHSEGWRLRLLPQGSLAASLAVSLRLLPLQDEVLRPPWPSPGSSGCGCWSQGLKVSWAPAAPQLCLPGWAGLVPAGGQATPHRCWSLGQPRSAQVTGQLRSWVSSGHRSAQVMGQLRTPLSLRSRCPKSCGFTWGKPRNSPLPPAPRGQMGRGRWGVQEGPSDLPDAGGQGQGLAESWSLPLALYPETRGPSSPW